MALASTEYKRRYNDKSYDAVRLNVKKGLKPQWQSYADKKGLSLNAFMIYVIENGFEHLKNTEKELFCNDN